MGLFKREKPLHEQLAEEGGLDLLDDPRAESQELAEPPSEESGQMSIAEMVMGPHLAADLLAIHGIPRAREWDAMATVEAPDLPGDSVEFVALEDGTLVVDDDLPDDALTPLADAFEGRVPPPYHAFAFRQNDDIWSVAALRVGILEVPEDIPGDQVDLVVNDGERTLLVDEAELEADVSSFEAYAAQQFGSFVLHATRLDDLLWEVTVLPL